MRVQTSFLLTALALSSVLSAQERRGLRVLPGPLPDGVRPSAEPEVLRATFDVQSGHLRDRRPVPAESIALGTACFDNTDLVCGMTAFGPWTIGDRPGDELLDWGVKQCNSSGMVQSITIAYRTTELDPADGGPGAALSFGLYRGTLGFNQVGTEVFRRTFTGLPAQRAPNGDTHTAPWVILTIDFGPTPLPLPDGPIGWGYMLLDNDSTVATGAVLVKAPNTVTGVIDALDVFSPGPASTGTYLGTFNFGSQCNHPPCCPDASTWLQIVEAPPAANVVNGSGRNPVVFSELLPARVGQGWVTAFDLSGRPATRSTMIILSRATLNPPQRLLIGELLLDLHQRLGIHTGTSLHVIPIPNRPALVGTRFCAQGLLQGPGLTLTNALETTIGF